MGYPPVAYLGAVSSYDSIALQRSCMPTSDPLTQLALGRWRDPADEQFPSVIRRRWEQRLLLPRFVCRIESPTGRSRDLRSAVAFSPPNMIETSIMFGD